MDDISSLIREAKPLYMKRKKRRRQLKTATAFICCVLFANVAFMSWNIQPAINDSSLDGLYAYLYDNETFEESWDFSADCSLEDYGMLAAL